MATNYDSANYPTPDEIRDGMLAAIRYSYAQDGIEVNVLPGSDHWRRAKVIADRVSILVANNRISVAALNPLTAQGQDLVDLASVYGVEKRPASGSAGRLYCLGATGATVALPAGFQATLPNGTKLVTVGAKIVVLKGQTMTPPPPWVNVRALKGGAATNAAPGTVAQWDSAAFGMLAQKCIVDPDGLTGGADEDDQETLRTRLLRKLRAMPIGGNWAHVKELAENSTAAVELAFVYPAARGPGSYDVAMTLAGASRELASTHVDTARVAIKTAMPGLASYNVTKCRDQSVDVVLNVRLPLPASSGGSGGGWKDGKPWPSTADSVLCKITARDADAKIITVNATSADAPIVGNRIAFWSSDDRVFLEVTIAAVSGSSGAYVLTLSQDLPTWVAVGHYVTASCENLSDYADGFVAQVALLGPGEKTDDPTILPRGRRHPPPDTENPSDLTEIQTAAVIASHREILGMSYAAVYEAGTTTTRTSPTLPILTKDPPKILTLSNFAIRRTV